MKHFPAADATCILLQRVSNFFLPLTISLSGKWGVLLSSESLVFFLVSHYSALFPLLQWICSQKRLPTSTQWIQFRERDRERHVKHADGLKLKVARTCDPRPTPLTPPTPPPNAPCIVTHQTGELADRQCSPEHSAVRYCTRRALRDCGSLLPTLFIYCCQTWSTEGCCRWCSPQQLPLLLILVTGTELWSLANTNLCFSPIDLEEEMPWRQKSFNS